MNAWASIGQAIDIEPLEAALMDIARALQPTPTQHREAESHYQGLARHVDGSASPLNGKVPDIYPSGSFAIHAAVRSSISRNQHDVDAVLELDIPDDSEPEWVLDTVYEAIRGEPGSKYYNFRIERNSRCVTVHYDDGVTVDLMPVVRIAGAAERVAELFHHKPETGEAYRKEVNPKGFADHFNQNVEINESFAKRFNSRRLLIERRTYGDMLVEGGLLDETMLVEKAETAPMPQYMELDQKSPRVVALQLLKRYRDKRYRKLDSHKGRRKPPSVMMAALALEAGPVSDNLFAELVSVANAIRQALTAADRANQLIEVYNPAHSPDLFTDRWPEDLSGQRLWLLDLNHLNAQLNQLQRSGFDPQDVSKIFTDLFGESASRIAIADHYEAKSKLLKSGNIGVTSKGQIKSVPASLAVTTGSTTSGAIVRPARANTNMGDAP